MPPVTIGFVVSIPLLRKLDRIAGYIKDTTNLVATTP